MAIQISGTTIINNSKQIQNIGGKGGIISGTFTVPGPQGFKSITISAFRGHFIGFVSLDPASNTTYGAALASLGFSAYNNSNSFTPYTIHQKINQNQAYITFPQSSNYTYQISNYLSGTKTIYYSFWYSGSTVPTITIS